MEENKNKLIDNKEENSFKEHFFDELNDQVNELPYSLKINNRKSNLNKGKNNFDKIKKVNIYFYLNFMEKRFVFPIISDIIIANVYKNELIQKIVKIINDKLFKININSIIYIISLKDIENDEDMNFYSKNYELKSVKNKNFSNFIFKNNENENIIFHSKNSLNIMIRESMF